ncbi:MAG: hypothetical protein L0191_07235, partial [Acidobacteria bacterium]|nr:hypothetical protein [Acidobacteriota bacterium]
KPELLACLQKAEYVLSLPLSQFEREGCPLEIQVPGISQSLFFVPTERDAQDLVAEGIRRGRIWTASELAGLCTEPRPTHDEVVSIARAKLMFSATIVDVRTGKD